eukprot:Skav225867  [mRNA]  locus=scaffold810:339208:341106:+ [translate_table: standard]
MYVIGRLSGGVAKVDSWRETKSLLGRELIQHGWSLENLDEVTSDWTRRIGTNKLFSIFRQSLSAEKRWSAICDSAKWAGISVSPPNPVKLRAIKTIQRAIRKHRPEQLQASSFVLCDGFFVNEGKAPLPVLNSVDLQKSGVCLVEYEEAMKWVHKQLPIVPDALAIVMIHNDEDPTGCQRSEPVTFPALDPRGRRVILRGVLWQLGEKKALIEAVKHQLDLPATIVVAATIWKDEADSDLWEACKQNLVKSVLGAMELNDRAVILEVWGRSFRDSRQKTDPDRALSGQFHFRVHRSQIDELLKTSGRHAIYFTPKSESKMSHGDWNMIWFKGQIEANIALSKTSQHAGLARTKDKWAVRVPTVHFDHVFHEIKPNDDAKANVVIKKLFKVQPVPAGTTNEHIMQWTEQMKWSTRVLKKLGKDAYLLGATDDPPHENVYLNDTLLLIKPVGNDKPIQHRSNPLIAGPKQPVTRKNIDKTSEAGELLEDSWALYRSRKGLPNNHQPSQGVAGGSSSAAAPQPQLDAPIAAKFAAFEKRMSLIESTVEKMDSNQHHIVQEVTRTGQNLQKVEAQLNDVHKQIQGGIEMAFAKSMQEQNKQLDVKFSQLAAMLQQGAAPKRAQPEPGDAWMESPSK